MVDFSVTIQPIDLNLAEYYDARIPFTRVLQIQINLNKKLF